MAANERESLIHKVIGAVYEVSNVLGAGFLEKVYERALLKELHGRGVYAQAQASFPDLYKGDRVVNFQKPKAEFKRVVLGL